METLEEYNKRMIKPPKTKAMLGIECPDCKEELYNPTPGLILLTSPAQINVECACGFSGYIQV